MSTLESTRLFGKGTNVVRNFKGKRFSWIVFLMHHKLETGTGQCRRSWTPSKGDIHIMRHIKNKLMRWKSLRECSYRLWICFNECLCRKKFPHKFSHWAGFSINIAVTNIHIWVLNFTLFTWSKCALKSWFSMMTKTFGCEHDCFKLRALTEGQMHLDISSHAHLENVNSQVTTNETNLAIQQTVSYLELWKTKLRSNSFKLCLFCCNWMLREESSSNIIIWIKSNGTL